jgi:hypothetical protein
VQYIPPHPTDRLSIKITFLKNRRAAKIQTQTTIPSSLPHTGEAGSFLQEFG